MIDDFALVAHVQPGAAGFDFRSRHGIFVTTGGVMSTVAGVVATTA